MDVGYYPSDAYDSEGIADVAAPRGYSSPAEVLADDGLSKDEKRSLLASWASDLRAVENWPALRRLDDGTLLNIDDILLALKVLDLPAVATFRSSAVPSSRRRRHIRTSHDFRPDDPDDDDPPPKPAAAMRPPFRSSVVHAVAGAVTGRPCDAVRIRAA